MQSLLMQGEMSSFAQAYGMLAQLPQFGVARSFFQAFSDQVSKGLNVFSTV